MVSWPHRISDVSRFVPVIPTAAALLALTVAFALTSCTDDDGADDGGRSPEATATAGAADTTGTPGSAGLRDPYFPKLGNGGYDVTHYSLTLDYEPPTDTEGEHLRGTAVITARATRDLSSFNLDFRGMDVESVTVEGAEAGWKRAGQELTVRPKGGVRRGEKFRTTVRYAGDPWTITDADDSQEGWLPTADGALALGEPTGSMAWFPGNHHPSDKATYDTTVTVPEGLHAVSNGELRDQSTKGGRTTFAWRTGQPMASYVATVAIGRYEIDSYEIDMAEGGGSDTGGSAAGAAELPAHVAVDPSQVKGSREVLGRLPDVMRWAENRFGVYPFSSTGAIVDRPEDISYALETQNRPVFPGAPYIELLVHEVAHQWYGDSVTPKSWRDMWLNEGFATYAEWLWQEEHGGDTAQEIFDALYAGDYYQDAASNDAVWDFPPAEPPSAARISDSPVYERGAMVLHKIREAIGDKAFFGLLKGWAAAHRHGNASTADFTSYAEEYARKAAPDVDLTPIWDDWLYGKGRPSKP